MKILHIILRPLFAICLFLSQFLSQRNTVFTDNVYMILTGILLLLLGILILMFSSSQNKEARNEKKIASGGPYKYIRHPIYTSMYILTGGLGLIFFTWYWFIVMVAFIPFWYMECRAEEKEMIKMYGEEYIKYRDKTGMFIPKLL